MRRFIFIAFMVAFALSCLQIQGKSIYWNYGRGYDPFINATKEGIRIENHRDNLKYDYFKLENPSEDFSIVFRAKNINGHPSKKYGYITSSGESAYISHPHWGFFITCEHDTLVFKINGGEMMLANESVPALEVDLYNLSALKQKSLSLSFTDGLNPYDGDNIWNVNIAKNKLNLTAGNSQLKKILDTKCNSAITGFGFFAGWGDALLVSDISITYDSTENPTDFSSEYINEYMSESEDPLEGYWTFFDRDLDESLLKPGGFYTLACIKKDDCYQMLYLDGSAINADEWQPGDIKAILKPTYFNGIYEVEWFDALKSPMNYDIKAQLGEGNTLNFQFPYQSSKFRLRKLDKDYFSLKSNQ